MVASLAVRLWMTLVGLGFRRWSTYRLAAFAGAFTNSVFGLIRSGVILAAIASAGGALGGYDALTGPTYVWLGQALVGPIFFFSWTELAQRIRTGDIAVDLSRPVEPLLAYLAADLGRALFVFLPRGLPPLAVGLLVTGLALPATRCRMCSASAASCSPSGCHSPADGWSTSPRSGCSTCVDR